MRRDIMNDIFDITYEELQLIRDLWEKNRIYHEKNSEFFGELYQSVNFEERMKAFGELPKEMLKITVIKSDDDYIGYCMSTIVNGKGELESMHVDEGSRGQGLGEALGIKHVQWMKEMKCNVIGVTVSQENEATIRFYKKIGFRPNTLYMQQNS